MKRINKLFVIVVMVIWCCSSVVLGSNTSEKNGNRALNNMVVELLNQKQITSKTNQKLSFNNPYEGWVFFSISGKLKRVDKVILSMSLSGNEDIVINHKDGKYTSEAMRYLSKGKHILIIKCQGKPSIKNLIIRAVPEMIYGDYDDNPHVKQFGPYDWEFLSKYILANANCIVTSKSIGDRQEAHVQEWKSLGKRWLCHAGVPGTNVNTDAKIEQSYQYWHDHPGLQNPLFNGIIVDEFYGGTKDPTYLVNYQVWAKALEDIYQDKSLKGKLFYPYTGPGICEQKESIHFYADTVMKYGGKIAYEYYYAERPTELALDARFELLTREVKAWQKLRQGSTRNLIAVFAYMSGALETVDTDPTVDFKVLMDKEMNLIANNPAFKGFYGVQFYKSSYTDEENVRWGSKLFRHYCIEGKRNLLSKELGYKYKLNYISNPDFEEGTSNWTLTSSEGDGIIAGSMEGWGWLEGRYVGDNWIDTTTGARTNSGDTFLKTKRSSIRPNIFSQEIRNLVPGRLYSLKMFSADYQNILNGVSEPSTPKISIIMNGADMLEDKCFDTAIGGIHDLGKFINPSNKPWMNFHRRVFRAKAKSANLEISDWADAANPGGPIGQEIMYNFIQIQPYYAN